MIRSKIISTGAYRETLPISNDHFLGHTFYDLDGQAIHQPVETIIRKFKAITGIGERRYAKAGMKASDMGAVAAEEAIARANINKEDIDLIIVAHNFGDIKHLGGTRDMVPSLASKIKNLLGIQNSSCIPYDLIFGCPGWLQALIHADQAIRSGAVKTCLVVGTETLSRVLDPTDRDSMIFSDGAGACIVQGNVGDARGIINSTVRSDTVQDLSLIYSGGQNDGVETDDRYIKMHGRKVYEYALKYVPQAMKDCLDRSGESFSDLKMVFLHQANDKMDEAILKRFVELYGMSELPKNLMPMNIAYMGNNSVATIPILLHQVLEQEIEGFTLQKNDLILFASVGAGMNINAITYRW